MQRARSGIPTLDHLLRGSLPTTPSIVVSGSQQDVYFFSLRLVWNRLNAWDLCLYGTVSRTREEVIADLGSKGWDVSPFIDAGTFRVVDYLALAEDKPGTPEERLRVLLSMSTDVLSPKKFYEVFIKQFRDMKGGHPNKRFFAILDSADRLIEAMGLENTLRFAEMTYKILSGTNSIGVALFCNEFVSDETRETVREAASLFIELREEWKEREVGTRYSPSTM